MNHTDDTLTEASVVTAPVPVVLSPPQRRRRALPRWFTAAAVVMLVLASATGVVAGSLAEADQLPVAVPANPMAMALEDVQGTTVPGVTSTTAVPPPAEAPEAEPAVEPRGSTETDRPAEPEAAPAAVDEPVPTTTTVVSTPTTAEAPATTVPPAEPTPWDTDPDWCMELDAITHHLPGGGWRCALTDGTWYDWHPTP